MAVTVVIPTLNEEEWIAGGLEDEFASTGGDGTDAPVAIGGEEDGDG